MVVISLIVLSVVVIPSTSRYFVRAKLLCVVLENKTNHRKTQSLNTCRGGGTLNVPLHRAHYVTTESCCRGASRLCYIPSIFSCLSMPIQNITQCHPYAIFVAVVVGCRGSAAHHRSSSMLEDEEEDNSISPCRRRRPSSSCCSSSSSSVWNLSSNRR